jgi:zinc transport system substrate-binding protein
MRFLYFVLLSLLLTSTLHASESLKVVTSIPPLNALTAGITAGVSKPTVLVPPEASHHNYSLKPSDRQALAEANVVIWIGEEMEIFLIKPIANLPKETTVISIINLPKLIRLPIRTDANWEMHNHAEDNKQHSHVDPHVWLDPQNAIYITQSLTDTFAQLDPKNAVQYKTNAEKMIQQINDLDKQLKIQLQPLKDKPFFVFHDAYQYFEHHYNVHSAGSITLNTDLPPSAKRVYQLQQRIKASGVHCIFAEMGTTPPIVETLARLSQTLIGHLDSIGKPNEFADYLQLLQYDANALTTCLTNM